MAAVRRALIDPMRPLLAFALALFACRSTDGSDEQPTEDPAEITAIAEKARELAATAAAAEPAISARMRELTGELDVSLAGFEHRLKTLPSLRRKIRSRVRADPELSIAEPDIVDALRYTVVIAAPRYTAVARRLLTALESHGHRVVRVKNYWPRGDNYSGVNVVLATRDLQWEIQFHTPESLAVRDAWHPAYERLRELTTPRPERQRLYGLMAVPWELVEIPPGAETGGNLHPREEVRRYPPP